MITDYGKQMVAIRLGSNINFPAYIGLGSGSGAVLSTATGLVWHVDRNAFTSTDFTTNQKFTFIGDWNSIEMSGIGLKEFGVFAGASGGSLWQREGFANITFDGTSELSLEITWQVY